MTAPAGRRSGRPLHCRERMQVCCAASRDVWSTLTICSGLAPSRVCRHGICLWQRGRDLFSHLFKATCTFPVRYHCVKVIQDSLAGVSGISWGSYGATTHYVKAGTKGADMISSFAGANCLQLELCALLHKCKAVLRFYTGFHTSFVAGGAACGHSIKRSGRHRHCIGR